MPCGQNPTQSPHELAAREISICSLQSRKVYPYMVGINHLIDEAHLVFRMLAKSSPSSTKTPDTWTCQAHHPRNSQEASKLNIHAPK